MRKFRRHSIVIIFIVAAIITPADVFTQFMVAIPLILLYEVSIFIAAYIERKRIKAEKALRLQEAAAERPALDQMMD
jgi:sec-independent protein translocase protein TatC